MVFAVRKQVGRVVAAVAVVGTLVSGCGGPGLAGSAVIVGDEAVPVDRVQAQLGVALSKTELLAQLTEQGGGPADLARTIVSREVLHDLLQRRAEAEGIVVTEAQIDAEVARSGGADALLARSLYDLAGLRQRVRDDLIAAQLAERAVDGLAVTADLVAATSREEAEEKARVLAVGGPAADGLLADQQIAARGMVYEAASTPDAAATVLFGTPVGGVVAFQPNPQQSSWIVFRVTDRRTGPPAGPQAASSISQSQLIAIGERLLQPTAVELGVRVNPRYGVWDPIVLRVVPAGQQVGTVLPPTAAG
jgi:hypothetical protein